ncbi:MAG: Holliday junction resolvase RuvX [Limnochordia bacterium]|jgi:putative Holliday junction resolvase|nr:Holliday junction resolvase RuvX [Bacillota bacterium]HOB08706.1 Holliday junction resolvase RuvX [Limnochordia bacterium]NLH32020.1 Holliday junction resolvase RuvX [Bacillota bacterium]HPT92697.1 Holliday junction resolvase RuvX [Limnochordia bacterium]HPZ30934.1 Holliday junction resolvase RuvX [Limnochordia bacterium]
MRVLGLDVGEKTIGVAVSDPLGITAQGLEVIRRSTLDQDLQQLVGLAASYKVEEIVVGMPRRTDGSYGPEAEKVELFAKALQKAVSVPVKFWDERFSTVTAQRILLEGDVSRAKRRQVVDKVAASIILQAYLDQQRGGLTNE